MLAGCVAGGGGDVWALDVTLGGEMRHPALDHHQPQPAEQLARHDLTLIHLAGQPCRDQRAGLIKPQE